MQSLVDRELMNRIMELTEENARYKVAVDLLEKLLKEKGNEKLVYASEVSKILGVARREIHVIEFED